MTDKEMKNEEPVIITFNEVEYRAEDLSDAQKDIAMKLNASGKNQFRGQQLIKFPTI